MKKYLKVFGIVSGISGILLIGVITAYFLLNRYPLSNATGETKNLKKEELLAYDKFYEGIFINDIDLKGLTKEEAISKIFDGDKGIKVDEHAGLLVDFMAKNSCGILIKGLRDVKDFSEEMTYSFANKKLSNGEVDTIFIPTSEKYTYVSSTFVKELAFYNQSLEGYVDSKVIDDILNRAKEYRG